MESTGRVAVVTGAGGVGIGSAVARELAATGARVAVTDVSLSRAEETAANLSDSGAVAMAVALDVSDEVAVERAFSRIVSEWGPVDVLVNNAGFAQTVSFTELDPAAWRRAFDVNITGTYLCSRAAVPGMLQRGAGAIVNVASFRALRSRTGVGYTAYAASKAAVIGFTQSLAVELGPHGIRCNAVAPGTIMNERLAAARPAEFFDEQRLTTPLRRLGEPRDVASVVVFLAGDASSYVTGETIYLTGGA